MPSREPPSQRRAILPPRPAASSRPTKAGSGRAALTPAFTIEQLLGLQRAAGNRATSAAASAAQRRQVVPAVTWQSAREPFVQRDDLSRGGSDFKSGISEQFEFKLGLNDPKGRVKISGKVTASRRGSKYLESPSGTVGPADAKWSLGENKATLERAGGRTSIKLASALARSDFSSPKLPGFPGLRVRASLKALEGKFDAAKSEADLDILKITVAVDGDLIEMLAEAGLAHLRDRVSCKVSLEAEVGLSIMDLTRLKAALRAKEEIKAAAEAAAKHGEDFAKRAEELKKLGAEQKKLAREVDQKRKLLDRQRRSLEAAKSQQATSKRGAARLRKQVAAMERQQAKAAKALSTVETKLASSRALTKSTAQAARASRAGLASAGQRLMKAGQKLEGALKGVTGKLGQFGKKALEKVTKRIMAKLGKTLLMKGLVKLIPGLNIISTVYDVGSLLYGLLSGDMKFGIPGLDDGGDGSAGKDGGGGSGGGSGSGSGTAPSDAAGDAGGADDLPPSGTKPGSAAPSKVQLTPTAKALADAYAGTSTVLDDDAAQAVNEGLPADITAAEMTELVARIKAKHVGGPVDPYELVAQIAAELADLRAGGTLVTVDGKTMPTGPDIAEPPRTLLPGTRDDVRQILTYDGKSGDVVVDAERHAALLAHVFDHPDGLKVKLSSIDVTSRRPGGTGDNLSVGVSITVQVVSLPSAAGASYPYKVDQTETVRMTFLYNPKRDIWGEMDYSAVHKLINTVRRDGQAWRLAAPNQSVQFEHATVTIKQLVDAQSVPGKDGTVHHFALSVVPTEITATEAGYLNPNGWVTFVRGKAVRIEFSLTESATSTAP